MTRVDLAAQARQSPTSTSGLALLSVEDLGIHFRTHAGIVQALEQVSFSLQAGETLAIVGESGSGKSVSALAIMGV